MTEHEAPKVGEPYVWGEQMIVPTYVAECETPRPNGECRTTRYGDEDDVVPAGWYVEFRYLPGDPPDQHRDFIPFPS